MQQRHEISPDPKFRRAYYWRRRLSHLFDDDASHSRITRLFNLLLALLIIFNVTTVILETVETIRARYEAFFFAAEHVATAIFMVEYVLRVWTAVDLHGGRFVDPIWGRLRYMRGFFPLIDLVSILPAVLGVLGAGDLRVLRLLRLLRMLKLTRHSQVFSLLWSVFREEARSIGALIFILCLTLTISGALAYMIEGDEQPTVFNSIPACMWWAIETLTTVGYGDMVPATAAGKLLGGLVSIIGIGTLALFSGVITVGFLDQLKHRREHHLVVTAETLTVEHTVRDTEALADGRWRLTSSNMPTVAAEPSREVCPHCGYRLTIGEREPGQA